MQIATIVRNREKSMVSPFHVLLCFQDGTQYIFRLKKCICKACK